MLQSSQLAQYLLVLALLVILIGALFLWALRKGISNIQKSLEFTDLEGAAIQRQLLALLGIPLFILFVGLTPLAWDQWPPYGVFVALIIGFAPLAYISVSSIRNRVSILRRLEPLPVKGRKAVWNGATNLALILLTFAGFAYYFAFFN